MVWSIPITLHISEGKVNELTIIGWIKLVKYGVVNGVLKLEQLYTSDKKKDAGQVYGTSDIAHPGLKKLFEHSNVYAAGEIRLIRRMEKGQTMRYSGPRETVFYAIVRKIFGCTHFMIGRDYAGVGNYYGTYYTQKIFNNFTRKELEIILLFFEHSFYCTRCEVREWIQSKRALIIKNMISFCQARKRDVTQWQTSAMYI